MRELLAAADYRAFLEAYFKYSKVSVAQFSRRAGFSSRGYPAEIANGKRRLSAKALPGFLRAFQLSSRFKLYFQYLVALGEPSAGATLKQILSRTRLTREDAQTSLDEMLRLGLATRENETYVPAATHFSAVGLGGSAFLRKSYLESLENARVRASAKFNSENELFLTSSLTVRKNDLPELKRELRRVLLNYIDEQIIPDGDIAIDLTVGLTLPG